MEGMRLLKAGKLVREFVGETLSHYGFPGEHWRSLWTDSLLKHLNREFWRGDAGFGGASQTDNRIFYKGVQDEDKNS